MRKLIRATLGLAFVAAFSLANTGNAATILTYGQTAAGAEVVNLQVTGGQSILRTGPTTTASPISVLIDSIGGGASAIPAVETFTLTSNSVASPGATTLGGFSGVITYQQGIGGATILTVTISNGTFSLQGAGAGGLLADAVFTNYAGAIQAQVGGPPTSGAASLSFNNIVGSLSGGITSAQNSGGGFNTSTVVPEPLSLVSGSIALLAGVGLFGARRLRSAKA